MNDFETRIYTSAFDRESTNSNSITIAQCIQRMFTTWSFLIKIVCLNCHRLVSGRTVARKLAINIRAGDEKAPTEKKIGRKQKLNARVQKNRGKICPRRCGLSQKKERRSPGLFNSRRRPYKLLGCFTQLFV